MPAFNERLKTLRNKSMRTQKQTAEAIETSEQNYQRYERGTQQPTLSVLVALADYFDVPLDYLVGRGIFSNWELILEHKVAIMEQVLSVLSNLNIDLSQLIGIKTNNITVIDVSKFTEPILMFLLPLLIERVDFSDNTINIHWHF